MGTEKFDPYRKWLGIPPKDQPPNHYRLLGLELFETDLDVIEGAVDRQVSFVRQYQSGEHAANAARILNELAQARLCLLKPATKAAYDEKLRREAAAIPQQTSAAEPVFTELPFGDVRSDVTPTKGAPQAKQSPMMLYIGGGVGVVACLLLVVFLFSGRKNSAVEKPDKVASAKPNDSITDKPKENLDSVPSATDVLWPESKLVVVRAGEPIDLIKLVDLDRDVAAGAWQKTDTVLIAPQSSKLYLPAKSHEDYQLKYKIRRAEGADSLILGFMMAGRQGMIGIDVGGAVWSGLYVDGREPHENCTSHRGKILGDQSASIVLTVHPGHLHATVDDKTILDWYGDPERLLLHTGHGLPSRESPFIIVSQAKYVVESASLIPIKPEKSLSRPARLDRVVNVTPLWDTERDARRGIWGMNKNSLNSPEGVGQICIPTVVPEEYTLSAKVSRPNNAGGEPTFFFGVVADQSPCRLTFKMDEGLALDMIDGRRWNENSTRLDGPFGEAGVPLQLDCTVTKQGVRVELDGRTVIDWTGDLRRLSMPYEWATADGRRLFIGTKSAFRFSEVKLGPPTPRPKSPDHRPITTDKAVNLLALVDPARDARQGTWKSEGKVLKTLADTEYAKLVIPVDVPDEYALTISVARESGGPHNNEAMCLALPFGSVKASMVIDGGGSQFTGLYLDLKEFNDNTTTYRGMVIPQGPPTEMEVQVRKTGIKVTSAGKTIVDWVGAPESFRPHDRQGLPGQRIGLAAWKQRFRFEKIEIRALPSTSFPSVPALPPDGDLRPVIDLARDVREGHWTSGDAGFQSPADYPGSNLRIPAVPPSKYLFEATVERRAGADDLLLGLIVGGSRCVVALDGAGGTRAGLELVDGKFIYDDANLTSRKYSARLLPLGQPVKIRCQVLPDTVVVHCDDHQVVRWHGDARRLSIDPRYVPPNDSDADRARLWIGSWMSQFHIRELRLISLSDDDRDQLVASFSGVFPISPQSAVPLNTSAATTTTTTPSTVTIPKPISSTTPWKNPNLIPIPKNVEVEAARNKLAKFFAKDFKEVQTPEQKSRLAERLLKDAADSADPPPDRYALYVEARELYLQTGDLLAAFRVVDSMAAIFDLARFEEKGDLLQKLAKKAKNALQHRFIAIVSWKLAGDAAAEEDYATAKEASARAVTAARGTGDSDLQTRALDQVRYYDSLLVQWKAAKAAEQVLLQQPDDTDANAKIGEYRCWARRDWETGLPSLRFSKDAKLAQIVATDLSNPAKGNEQRALADSWVAYAKSQKVAVIKASAAERATIWYEKAIPGLRGTDETDAAKDLESSYELAYGRAFNRLLSSDANGLEVDSTIDCKGEIYPLKLKPSFDLKKSWLLSFEFNPPNLDGGWHQIFFWGDGAPGDDPLWVRIDGNRLSAVVENTAENRGQWIDYFVPATAVGKWNDLKFVYDGTAGNLELYINHRLIRRESLSIMPLVDRGMPLYLGGAGDSQRYVGQVRKVWLGNIP